MLGLVKHKLKNTYRRFVIESGSEDYRRSLIAQTAHPQFEQYAKELLDKGVIVLPGYFSGKTLKAMQDDFNRWAADPQYDKKGFSNIKDFPYTLTADSYALSMAAVDPFLVSVLEYYWGKPVSVSQAYGRRTGSGDEIKTHSWLWHHDAKHKQTKIMIYLTDVTMENHRMDYILGSHTHWRDCFDYKESRKSDEEALKAGELFHCVGPAGTVVLFDTNGLHRGNRGHGNHRDVWTYHYDPVRSLEKVPFHPDAVKEMSEKQHKIARII